MKGTRGEIEREKNDAKTFKKHIIYGSSFVRRIVGVKKRRDFCITTTKGVKRRRVLLVSHRRRRRQCRLRHWKWTSRGVRAQRIVRRRASAAVSDTQHESWFTTVFPLGRYILTSWRALSWRLRKLFTLSSLFPSCGQCA